MAKYVSVIRPGESVIDDNTPIVPMLDPIVDGEQMSRGLIPRDWEEEPYASVGSSFPEEMLIDEDEWPERIEEMERTKTRISDLLDQAGLTVLNQNGTNYCWINAPVHCVEIIRCLAGEEMIRLSPASCGGPIKGYRNVGGWGAEGLRYIIEHGIVPQSMWPPNAIDRRLDTPQSREERKKFRTPEWVECRPRTTREWMSLLLQRIPVAVGYNWWRHEVTMIDPVRMSGGSYAARINNSWGTGWKDNGRSILSGSRVQPDDAVAPRTAIPLAG